MAHGGPSALTPGQLPSKKRKDVPSLPSNGPNKRPKNSHRPDHRAKQRDARTLATQTTGKAFKNGELDLDKFVRAREYEIRALEEGLTRSKKALNRRAFQQVPKDLRRRTASHNVKKVPKRLRERAKKEMAEDNTPTVTANKRKPTRHMRLRLETAKRLRALGAKKKAEKEKAKAESVTVIDPNAPPADKKKPDDAKPAQSSTAVKSRPPKVKKAALASPPVPKAKFRKRQIYKSWLPTHLFHAKRAHMTPPSTPMWRFCIPLSPTAKSYRPTHRASHERGAVAWDMSYMSTIGLQGRLDSILGLLKALGVASEALNGRQGEKWRAGARVLETFVYMRVQPHELIAPVTLVWCVPSADSVSKSVEEEKQKRKLLVRVHPSAFYQLWEEVLRLGKVSKPQVSVEDLRFDIGSIDITGPGATEALLGALWPSPEPPEPASGQAQPDGGEAMQIDSEPNTPTVGQTWTALAGLNNPAMLPRSALLSLDVQDPRLHHPPRTINLPKTDAEQHKLLELIASWPVEVALRPSQVFDRKARLIASAALPSQKAINRRKSLALPGQYPEALAKDPRIPVLLYTSTASAHAGRSRDTSPASSTWTLLAPWKCIQPIWYSIMYYPLSTGQQPRFGGLSQRRQLAFEAGVPMFPVDFPGTKAGWEWEMQERRRREEEWRRKPKGKRVSWEKVELGGGKKGEMGVGWACDWERLLAGSPAPEAAVEKGQDAAENAEQANAAQGSKKDNGEDTAAKQLKSAPLRPTELTQLPAAQARALLEASDTALPPPRNLVTTLTTVRLALLTRGVSQACARIYRLPSAISNVKLRKQWLALLPTYKPRKQLTQGPKQSLPRLPKDAPPHVVQERLAQSLLELPKAGEDEYPACPVEEDLIGFVTTGNFNLEQGQGTGIGNVLIERVMEEARRDWEGEGRVVVVRNAGDRVGRLARWTVV
ncbi:hypothetical protein BAUCODRAFT_157940 [Baudoinia panamericana UAMH 10762]|uniref:Pop1 N-terminal domain-containing protein n=1 Tax=Baudoinia panamericana (strain UAMH 10762) TaxID=717646 RepID=M2N6A6_BAUPA|nr:uncharacterized protein BAUCODRAFT_157940 [Baudoinia panamericana UAMH 10762]EMC94315.1 hypothetical protein BAUCODRAFT_157940 [Baudoinia panamericana UAMH 10762]